MSRCLTFHYRLVNTNAGEQIEVKVRESPSGTLTTLTTVPGTSTTNEWQLLMVNLLPPASTNNFDAEIEGEWAGRGSPVSLGVRDPDVCHDTCSELLEKFISKLTSMKKMILSPPLMPSDVSEFSGEALFQVFFSSLTNLAAVTTDGTGSVEIDGLVVWTEINNVQVEGVGVETVTFNDAVFPCGEFTWAQDTALIHKDMVQYSHCLGSVPTENRVEYSHGQGSVLIEPRFSTQMTIDYTHTAMVQYSHRTTFSTHISSSVLTYPVQYLHSQDSVHT